MKITTHVNVGIIMSFFLVGGCASKEVDSPESPVPSAMAIEQPDVPVPPELKGQIDAYMARDHHEGHDLPITQLPPFFLKMSAVRHSFLPLDGAHMVAASKVIVRGTIEDILEGRTIDFVEGASHPLFTVVAKIAVLEVLKGSADRIGSHIYVEMFRAPFISVTDLASDLPKEEVTVFLRQAFRDRDVHTYTGGDTALPDDSALYSLRTPQGLLVKDGDYFVQPLDSEPIFDDGVESFDDVAATIGTIVDQQNQ